MSIKDIRLESIGLSNRAINALKRAGLTTVGDIEKYDEAALLELPALGANTAREIIQKRDSVLALKEEDVTYDDPFLLCGTDSDEMIDLRLDPEFSDSILSFTRLKDRSLSELGLKGRPLNQLLNNGFTKLSDIVLLTRSDLLKLPAMGEQSIRKVLDCVDKFVSDNESMIRALHSGDTSVLWDDDQIKQNILNIYSEEGFHGFSFNEIKGRLNLPDDYSEEHLKSITGRLIADKELEYVDYRLYRCYRKFADYLEKAPVKSDRNKTIVQQRLIGKTLAEIGEDHNITRERVRQIINKTYKEVQSLYLAETGLNWFDEEYYEYFYKTYYFDKSEGSLWFNISPATWRYLDMLDIRQGEKDLADAVEDPKIDAGLRLKIKSYLNRNKVFIDGHWVEKKRYDLEETAVRMLCKEDTAFSDFCERYNEFLQAHDVEFDEKLYITDAVRATRRNHLPNANFLLWKKNETIRYYDIESRDYNELLEELALDAFENIELSTAKFMRDHPDIMKRYDIRDQYELHNLMRKIIPEGSYHNLRFGRMPMIVFGTFDRDAAITEMLLDNAPIEQSAFADLINAEYGFDQATVIGTYLKCISKYLRNGIYTMDHKIMDPESMSRLKSELTDDFYYIREIKEIYNNSVPSGHPDDINSYNLRSMGFTVLSNCVLQNYTSLETYYEHLFTETEIVDIKKYKKRFGAAGNFYGKLMEMKRDLTIVEFEPDQVISFTRLERAGVTRELIKEFCDEVYAFVGEGEYFSSQSIRKQGFEHELYDLGFSDWFYANLLISDGRFSFNHIYGNIILYTGNEAITISSFQANVIEGHGCIDTYDLMSELEEIYGCSSFDRYDITFRIKGTDVFYDSILDRLYANADVYEAELEAAERF